MNSLIQRYDTAASLLHIAATLSDYVIVDCQTNITQDHLTFTALEMSGRKIIIHTPDMRGISFRLSNVTMLADSKYNMENAIQVLNKVRTISPVDSIERVIGNINYTLPLTTESIEHFVRASPESSPDMICQSLIAGCSIL